LSAVPPVSRPGTEPPRGTASSSGAAPSTGSLLATGVQGRRGRFIVLEGPDGAGKSEQAVRLAERLRQRGYPVTFPRDPADTRRGPIADALLFNAARSQHVLDVIRPALERGDIVVCDRYSTSTLAYQGYGSGIDLGMLVAIGDFATGGLAPDLVVVVDVPVEVGLARRDAGRVEELTRFEDGERHDLDFHRRVRAGYLEMASADPQHWAVVDGDRSPEEVAVEVGRVVEAALPAN
jgi:dTMP kinase